MTRNFSEYPRAARRILLTAERLIGEHGIESVSLRRVVTSAGQANNSAVQHYFGSKKGLITAVYLMRQNRLDQARQRWVQGLEERGSLQVADYMAALMLPIFHVFRPRIQMTYALFALRLIEDGDLSDLNRVDLVSPAVQDIRRHMRECLSHLPFETFRQRYVSAVRCFFTGFAEIKRTGFSEFKDIDQFWDERFQAAVGIMLGQFPPDPRPLPPFDPLSQSSA